MLDLKRLFHLHPQLAQLLHPASPSSVSFERDIQRINKEWVFDQFSVYAQAYPPPDPRRVVLFRKYFEEPSWRKRRSSVLHEVGHYSVYDCSDLPFLRAYIAFLEQDLNAFYQSKGLVLPSDPTHRILVSHPDGAPGVRGFIDPLKLPDELGADAFVHEMEPRLFAWRARERIQQNDVAFREMKAKIEHGCSVNYDGGVSINRIVRLQASAKLGVSQSLKKEVKRICSTHERILRNSPSLQTLNHDALFSCVEEFCSLVLNRKRANSELVPLFKRYTQQFGPSLFHIRVPTDALRGS